MEINSSDLKQLLLTLNSLGKMPVSENSAKSTAAGLPKQDMTALLSLMENSVAVSELLQSAGLTNTKQNTELIKTLITAGLPVNKQNLQRLNQASKLFSGDMPKSVFLVKNTIVPNEHNAAMLNGYTKREINLSHQISDLFVAAQELPESELKQEIMQILGGGPEEPEKTPTKKPIAESLTPEKSASEKTVSAQPERPAVKEGAELVPEKYVLRLEPEAEQEDAAVRNKTVTPKEALEPDEDGFIRAERRERAETERSPLAEASERRIFERETGSVLGELRKDIAKVKQLIESSEVEVPRLERAVDNAVENLKFLSEIKDSKYIQIPININAQSTNAEIFIFDDDKHVKSRLRGSVNALLALDIAGIGHFESFIQKSENTLFMQFRVDNAQASELVSSNLPALEAMLASANMRLGGYSVITADEPFKLTDDEPRPFEAEKKDSAKPFDIRL